MTSLQTLKDSSGKIYIIAWVFGLVFYFLDYVVRSAPAVMIPQLSETFQVNSLSVVSIIGTYYITYSTISLVAGLALDNFGANIHCLRES